MEREELLDIIKYDKIFDFKTLLRKTKVSKYELQAMLDKLASEGKIIYEPYYEEYYPLLEAKLAVKDQGYAFATVEDEEKDYFIPEDYLGIAYNGDTAIIYPYEMGSKLYNAKVFKILEHANMFVIGILKAKKTKKGTKYYISSNMRTFPVSVGVRPEHLNDAAVGTVVKADLVYEGTAIRGIITETVGYPDDPGIDISEIALEFGFKTPFPEDVIEEIESIPDEALPKQLYGRRDFRDKNVITIDGDDSKDFDDAVYVEKLDNGNYQLEVYIADVAEYVRENTPLDKEAISRGTSVYLADRVIPMLPRKLSNGICSLNEGVDRLVLACLMEIDYKGNLVNYEICEGVIKSHHRMTYKKVNKILDGDPELCREYSDLVDMVKLMAELSKLIRDRRYKKGGLEFEVDEYKISLNEDGSPKDIILRTREDAEKLIEDFMLEANETVAYHMNIMNLPCVYRIHEKPDQEKLHNVFSLISNMGVKLQNTQNDIHPKQIQTALEKIADSPYQPVINSMLLRSMMKAKYSEKCLGHYGLAMNYYCHFTSPIRRYPDLMTHRMIKKLLLHPVDLDEQVRYYEGVMPEIGVSTSASERRAVECEREVDDMLYAWYMTKHIYEHFNGIITSLTAFGMFVTLDNGIEGLVQYRDMDGFFNFDNVNMKCSDGRRTYRIGDSVRIVVIHSSKKERKIDFMLEEDYEVFYE